MALAGTLRDFSLADIFQLISFQRKTGILTLKSQDATVTVSVINGTIVSADSLPKRIDDHLGQVLVKKGLITAEQLEKALVIQAETMQKMGYILTHSNFITTEALKESLQTQILQIIFRLFRWTDGEYEFAQSENLDYDKEFINPIQIENVLMEGMRMLDEWPIIVKKIPSFNLIFKPTVKPNEYIVEGSEPIDLLGLATSGEDSSKIKLSSNENFVLQLLNGTHNVQAIIDCCRLTEFETCRALYDLLSRNLIIDIGKLKVKKPAADIGRGLVLVPTGGRWDFRPTLTWIFVGISIVSLAVGIMRPFAIFYKIHPPILNRTDAQRAARFVEMKKIAQKIRVYYLHSHSYPTSLVSLQEVDLIFPEEIIDNGMQKYDLEVRDGGLALRELGVKNPLIIRIELPAPPTPPPPPPPASATAPNANPQNP